MEFCEYLNKEEGVIRVYCQRWLTFVLFEIRECQERSLLHGDGGEAPNYKQIGEEIDKMA